jgi:Flp pilus assembly pilin Flp
MAYGLRRPFRRSRKGQTAIEYLLVTVSLLFVFVMMYRSLQWYLSDQFTRGGVIILQMYKEDPW